MSFLSDAGVLLPIIQAPMAGVSTPEMAIAVSDAGGLGSIAVGASDAAGAGEMIEAVRASTDRPFNVNVFVHEPSRRDTVRERAWLEAMEPVFAEFGARPPAALREIYRSFNEDEDMLTVLVELAPPIVSFHFGLPSASRIAALKGAGCRLLATATNLDEALAAKQAGIDALVAQGIEAGAHRGVFDPAGRDPCLGTAALTRLLVLRSGLPVIAAGGIMDGQGIAAMLRLGAEGAQLGTAFIGCPESSADEAYRQALFSPAALSTRMTSAISGRPARSLPNRFTEWSEAEARPPPPDYPVAYDAGKAINAAAKRAGENGFGAQWAGQGAPLARAMPAAELVRRLHEEMASAVSGDEQA